VVFIVWVVTSVVVVVLWVVAPVVAAVVVVVLWVVAVVMVVVAAVVCASFAQPVDGQPGRDRPYPALKGSKMSRLASEKPMRGALITLLPVAVALLACGYDNDSETMAAPAAGGAGGGSTGEIAEAAIDTGAALASVAGQGAGTLVGYEGAGKWHLNLTCDTAISSERCHWDIFIEPLDGARIRNVSHEGLDGEDAFDWDGEAARLIALTGTDNDALVLETDPGKGLRIDVLLDDAPGNEFIYWIGGGAIHRGAPTNPIDLVPTEP
jgi:hypothetical protein